MAITDLDLGDWQHTDLVLHVVRYGNSLRSQLRTANAQPGTRYWCRPTFVFSDRSVTISVLGVERNILFLKFDATAGHPGGRLPYASVSRPEVSSFGHPGCPTIGFLRASFHGVISGKMDIHVLCSISP